MSAMEPPASLSVQQSDALWDAVAVPGPRPPTYPEQWERVCRAVARIIADLTPGNDETGTLQAVTLSTVERRMLIYALDQAQERIWAEDGFTDEDQAAVDSLRRLVNGAPALDPVPRRGDQFETWLTAQRHACLGHASSWGVVDGLLEEYLKQADAGVPLGQQLCFCATGSPGMYEGPARDCLLHGERQLVVAYRAPGLDVIYCVQCCPDDSRFVGLETTDLPDGGICENCDTDVLIRVKPSPCPRCGEDVSGYRPDDLVYRVGDKRAYCSGECVVAMQRASKSEGEVADADLIEAAREIGLVEPEKAPAIVAAARELMAQSGVDTPGCDCGHEGMGPARHLKACAWLKTLNAPHPDRVIAEKPEWGVMTNDGELTEVQKAYKVAQGEMFKLAAFGHHRYHPSGECLTNEGRRQHRDYLDRIQAAREGLEAAVLRLVAEHAEQVAEVDAAPVKWLRMLASEPAELSLLVMTSGEREEVLEGREGRMTSDDVLNEQIAAALHAKMPGCTHDEYGGDCKELSDAVMPIVSAGSTSMESERNSLVHASGHLVTCQGANDGPIDPDCPCRAEHPWLYRVTAHPTDGRPPQSQYYPGAHRARFWRDQVTAVGYRATVARIPAEAFEALSEDGLDRLAQEDLDQNV